MWSIPDHQRTTQNYGRGQSGHTIAPYEPPSVITYYKPQPCPTESVLSNTQKDAQKHSPMERHTIENRDSRFFAPLEAHYTEPPMSHSEAYPETRFAYGAKDYDETVREFSRAAHPKAVTEVAVSSGSVTHATEANEVPVKSSTNEKPSGVVYAHSTEAVVEKLQPRKEPMQAQESSSVELNKTKNTNSNNKEV